MQVEKLTRSQIIDLYPYLETTFPEAELKPLHRMLASYEQGNYDCFGLKQNGETVGYAFFVRTGNDLLLDYFGILEPYQSLGLGSGFMKLLIPFFEKTDSVLAEVEDPDAPGVPDPTDQRGRRTRFYLRNGFLSTDVRVLSFGVRYLLLEYPVAGVHPEDSIRSIYRGHYRAMLSKASYEKNIMI